MPNKDACLSIIPPCIKLRQPKHSQQTSKIYLTKNTVTLVVCTLNQFLFFLVPGIQLTTSCLPGSTLPLSYIPSHFKSISASQKINKISYPQQLYCSFQLLLTKVFENWLLIKIKISTKIHSKMTILCPTVLV